MKKVLFVCLMVLMSSVALVAQNNNNMQERMKERMENYIKELKLDEKKATDFRKVYTDASEKMQKEMAGMRDAGSQDRETMRTKMTKLTEERDAEIKKILSEDEFKKFKELISKEPRRRPRN